MAEVVIASPSGWLKNLKDRKIYDLFKTIHMLYTEQI
jgi:hypothetical protein